MSFFKKKEKRRFAQEREMREQSTTLLAILQSFATWNNLRRPKFFRFDQHQHIIYSVTAFILRTFSRL